MLNSNLCHKTSLTCKYSHGLLSWSGHGRVVSICSAWEKNSSIFIKDKYYLKNHLLKRQIWIICIAKMPQQGGHSGLFGYRNSTPNGGMIRMAIHKTLRSWIACKCKEQTMLSGSQGCQIGAQVLPWDAITLTPNIRPIDGGRQ